MGFGSELKIKGFDYEAGSIRFGNHGIWQDMIEVKYNIINFHKISLKSGFTRVLRIVSRITSFTVWS